MERRDFLKSLFGAVVAPLAAKLASLVPARPKGVMHTTAFTVDKRSPRFIRIVYRVTSGAGTGQTMTAKVQGKNDLSEKWFDTDIPVTITKTFGNYANVKIRGIRE